MVEVIKRLVVEEEEMSDSSMNCAMAFRVAQYLVAKASWVVALEMAEILKSIPEFLAQAFHIAESSAGNIDIPLTWHREHRMIDLVSFLLQYLSGK